MINWAKRLLKPKDSPSLLEDGFDEEGNPVEVDEPTCDICGKILGPEHSECLACGVSLCGDEKCRDKHIAERCTVPSRCCDYCGRDIDPDADWTLETRDGTERFCCAECRDERAAEIEYAPLCAWCREKCDQGTVHAGLDPKPFCSTECLEQYRKSAAHGAADHVCACCGKAIDGPSYVSPGYPKLKFCSRQCYDDYLSEHLNPFNS